MSFRGRERERLVDANIKTKQNRNAFEGFLNAVPISSICDFLKPYVLLLNLNTDHGVDLRNALHRQKNAPGMHMFAGNALA